MASAPNDYANLSLVEKLQKILVEETKDVKFIFESNGDNNSDNDGAPAPKNARYDADGDSSVHSGNVVTISAHKKVLAASSPVFNAMFNGALKETGDVKIKDASPDAFRAFLQIFYCNEVKLTKKNLDEVMGLVDKYDVDAGWPSVEAFFKENLAIDDILWGLHSAMKFRRSDLITFCTIKVEKNCAAVCEMIEIDDSGKAILHLNPNNRRMSDADLTVIFARVFAIFKKCISQTTNVAANMSLQMIDSHHPERDSTKTKAISFSSNYQLLLTHITYTDIYDQIAKPLEYDVKIQCAEVEMWQRVSRGRIVKLKYPILIQPNRINTLQTRIITKFAWQPTIILHEIPTQSIALTSKIKITFDRAVKRSIVSGMNFLQCDL